MNRLNNEDSLALAKLLVKKMALDIEADDSSKNKIAIELFTELDLEAQLLALRSEMGIEFIIKYKLDEDPLFYNLLSVVNGNVKQKNNNNA